MFGKGKREREELERSGTRAPATVVEIAGVGYSIGSGGGDRSFEASEVSRMCTLRVQPEGQPEFEVRKRMRFGRYGRTVPSAGDRIEVLYDPADHQRMVVAPPTPEEEGARRAAALNQSGLISGLGGGGGPAPDVAAQIKQLESYRDSGAISDEHFEAAKQALLGGR
jgi:hypothetical protein